MKAVFSEVLLIPASAGDNGNFGTVTDNGLGRSVSTSKRNGFYSSRDFTETNTGRWTTHSAWPFPSLKSQ